VGSLSIFRREIRLLPGIRKKVSSIRMWLYKEKRNCSSQSGNCLIVDVQSEDIAHSRSSTDQTRDGETKDTGLHMKIEFGSLKQTSVK
jgi:hypothetical protein